MPKLLSTLVGLRRTFEFLVDNFHFNPKQRFIGESLRMSDHGIINCVVTTQNQHHAITKLVTLRLSYRKQNADCDYYQTEVQIPF